MKLRAVLLLGALCLMLMTGHAEAFRFAVGHSGG